MEFSHDDSAWRRLSYEEKNRELLKREIKMLDILEKRGAISRTQLERSSRELRARMATGIR